MNSVRAARGKRLLVSSAIAIAGALATTILGLLWPESWQQVFILTYALLLVGVVLLAPLIPDAWSYVYRWTQRALESRRERRRAAARDRIANSPEVQAQVQRLQGVTAIVKPDVGGGDIGVLHGSNLTDQTIFDVIVSMNEWRPSWENGGIGVSFSSPRSVANKVPPSGTFTFRGPMDFDQMNTAPIGIAFRDADGRAFYRDRDTGLRFVGNAGDHIAFASGLYFGESGQPPA